MKRDDYKRVFDQVKPDALFEQRLAREFSEQKTRKLGFNRRVVLSAAASIMIFASVFVVLDIERSPNQTIVKPPYQQGKESSVYIPKIEMPTGSIETAKMIGLIVYQGRIYTQTLTKLPADVAREFLGEKIGRTKGNIDEQQSIGV